MNRALRWILTGATGIAGIAGIAVVATAELQAAAGTTPTWRISTVIGSKRASDLLAVVATGPRSAWAFGDGVKGKPLALRWNGTTWTAGSLPEANARPHLVSAASRTDVWAGGTVCEGGPGAPPFSSYVSRWNGTRWSTTKFTHIDWCAQTLVTSSYTNGWLFTSGARSLALHLHGARWQDVRLGTVGTVLTATAVSASDVWGFTYGAPGRSKAEAVHWNGQAWRTVPFPAISLKRGQSVYPWASYSSKGTGVWVSVTKLPGVPYPDSTLLHWTRDGWQRVTVPGGSTVVAMTADGTGGLWCLGWSQTSNTAYAFLHYARGSWTTDQVPIAGLPGNPTRVDVLVYDIANIPGTRALWATGQADYYNRQDVQQDYSVIYRYGR